MSDYTQEVLCDERKQVVIGSQGFIDDSDSMSEDQQKEMWLKVFVIQIEVNMDTENNPDLRYRHAQAGMLRSTKIRLPDAHQGSRYKVIPVTAKHNMETKPGKGKPQEGGIKLKYVTRARLQRVPFIDIGVEAVPLNQRTYVKLRDRGPETALQLPLGLDVAYGAVIEHPDNDFTRKFVSFDVVDHDFELEERQKVGIVVWRRGRIYEAEALDPYAVDDDVDEQSHQYKLTEEEEKRYYGPPKKPVILTGEITGIYEGGKVFRHNINTYPGCSGAVIFLLDKHQTESVSERDMGCVIGVHAGGRSEERFNLGMAIYKDFLKATRPEDYFSGG